MAAHSNGRRGVGEISERDLEIYRLAWCDAWSQRHLAAKFQLSGSRIQAILNRVHDLLSRREQQERELPRARRLESVRQQHEARLEQLYEETLRAWEQSQQPCVTIRVKERNGRVVSTTQTVTTQNGDPRLLREAQKIACQLADFRSGGRSLLWDELPVQPGASRVIDSHLVQAGDIVRRPRASLANIERVMLDSAELSSHTARTRSDW
jgi:hypothetical protein